MINTLWSDQMELQVQIGIGRPDDQTFTLDDPVLGLLDGTGTLGSPDAPYADNTCDVRAVRWRAGATRADGPLTRWESGTCSLTLDNNQNQYDITGEATRFLPMVPIRIRARLHGETDWTPQWSGFVDVWSQAWSDDGDETVTVSATDGTKLLSSYETPAVDPLVGVGESASARVTRILNEAEWTDGRRINTGGQQMLGTDLGADAWSLLLKNQDAELGETYVDKDGAFVFFPRQLWFDQSAGANIKHSFGPSDLRYEDVRVVNDDTNFKNIVEGARKDGEPQTVRDNLSVQTFKPRRYSNTDLTLLTDPAVLSWCNIILQTGVSLRPRMDQMQVLPQADEDLWPVIKDTQYGDRWQVTIVPPNYADVLTKRVQVRGWQHDVTYEQWRVTYTLDDAQLFQPFQLDSPDEDARLDIMRLM